jgi:8-oxo-dGTP pyrophosphatase MutT (NUDIX family)
VHRFATVILVDRRGWLLLQERDEHPVIAPEQWAMCGGHLEPGEDFLTGAVRELEEETGVRLAPDDLTLYEKIEVHHEEYGTVDTLAVYAAATDLTDDDIVLGEGRQIVFVEPVAARALDLGTSAARVVPAFLDSELYRNLSG